MTDDVEERRKSSFKRRFSLDIMRTAPKLFFRRTSNIDSQVMTLKVSDFGDDSLQRSPVSSPLPVSAKKEKVFGVLLLENNTYKVLNGEDERHLNQLLIQAHEDYTVVSYRLIIQNIRYTFRIEPIRKRQGSLSPRLDVTFSFAEDRRIDILLEWLNSETDSCQFLHNLVESYVKPLRQLPSLTDEDHEVIFKDVEQLLKATLDLVQKMQCLCSNWNDSDNSVGCLFSEVIDSYNTYVTNYPKYIRRLEAKMKFDQSFSQFCQGQESRGKLPLETLLYLPMLGSMTCKN
ncbi:hypothetical protein LOTGIDRAFT_161117 [Lottia gigantea]|uniref:DH domain-containing protein n=1 Tax=Lottia gigantea TaxID=225164 RepID=V4ADE8_LOTGI|nr:hypothetical protein LOTGIDRAFT_161117 [Lottia gigantea]ESO94867.1 hypothetical protein LOTGIDRAFT_161117 [Lottia gigantea]